MKRDLKGPAAAPAMGWHRRSKLRRGGGASPAASATDRARTHRDGTARAVMLALACGLFAMLLFTGTAAAAGPPLDSSFECSVATPCGSFTSWNPTFVSVSQSSGKVYVIDSANDAIEVFDASGTYQSQILGSSTTAGTFSFGAADDITVDNSGGANDGRVYVESQNSALLFAFDSSGSFLWQSSAGLAAPTGIAVDPSGNPWIADLFNGVQELSAVDGSTVGSPILASEFPGNIDFDSSGNIAVVVGGVSLYDQAGNLLHRDNTLAVAVDVAVERTTNSVYAVDANGVTVFDSSGNVIAGTPFGPTNAANSVAVNAADGRIYVAEPTVGAKVEIYDLQLFTVGVTANGTGSGRVDADSGRISGCTSSGGTCSDTYMSGETVTLVAAPASGSSFTGWTDCDNPSGNTCVESVTSARAVTATFDLIPTHVLRTAIAGSGSGTISSTDSRISCGATCQATYEQNALVALTARAAPGSTFTGWSGGGCSGTGSCQVTMNADTTVTATFTHSPTVTTGGASGVTLSTATVSGIVNPNGAAATCTFDYGTSTAYGSSVPCGSAPGAGASDVTATAGLSGLAAGTTYHYRIVATNAGGTSNGGDATFTTASVTPPPPPTCQTNPSLCPRPKPGVLHLAKATVTASGGKVVVQLSCVGGTTCHGTLQVTARVKTTTGKGRSRKTRTVTLVVAKGSVKLGAGKSGKATLTLTRSGRQLLARTRQLRTTLAGGGLRHTLVIRNAVKPKKHR